MNKYFTLAEELERGKVIAEYMQGNSSLKDKAKLAHEELFFSNVNNVYKQVHKLMRQFNITHYELEDAIQEGLCELARGLWEYNPSRNCKAYTNIHFRVQKNFFVKSNLARTLPLNSGGAYKAQEVAKLAREYESLDNPQVDLVTYVSQKANIPIDVTVSLIELNSRGVSSLDTVVRFERGSGQAAIIDLLPSVEPEIVNNGVTYSKLEKLLNNLNETEKTLITYEYELDDKLKELSFDELLEKYQMTSREYSVAIRRVMKKLTALAQQQRLSLEDFINE